MTFEELQLANAIVAAVREQGYTAPTPIQEQAIPLVLQGHDLLAGAQTGTGKTAAFALPILHRLTDGGTTRPAGGIRALILSPTRELAAQIEENLRAYARHLPVSSTVIFGGVGMKPQIDRIALGVDILVATPGRLLDLQQQGHLDLSAVQILVLDEADRMLDMGFIHDVKKVLALLPANKQSLLFSATFSDDIRELAAGLLRNPQSVQVTPRNTTVQRISQVIHPVGRDCKKDALLHVIREHDWSQVLVFTRTKFGANHVADFLNRNGISAMALHGNKSQSARTQALAGFKTGELRVLVATDIAARGIDIDDLPHVVNYEIPNVPEDYVHRIGRTGRAGREGQAVSFVCLDEEGFMLEIERFTQQEIPVKVLEGFGPAPDEKAEPIAMGRQTLWGGAGKPPGREVMAAAAKAARQEMMERIRANKAAQTERSNARAAARQRPPASETPDIPDGAEASTVPMDAISQQPGKRRGGQGYNRSRQRPSARDRQRNGLGNGAPDTQQQPQPTPHRPKPAKKQRPAHHHDEGHGRFEDQPPSNAHLGTQLGRPVHSQPRHSGAQPDPMRTSVDLMAERPRRSGFSNGGGKWRRSGGAFNH